MVKTTGILILCFLWSGLIHSQQTEEYHFKVESQYLNETRDIWVSLPKFYHQNKYECHTLYLFDGDAHQASKTFKAIRNELFEVGGYIRPLIIVGIEQIKRSSELSPYGERGNQFLNFIERELIPLVDSTFHTNSDRIVAGHSMGGYFALNVWMKSNQFNSCFAFSPAIYNRENQITRDLVEYLSLQKPKGVVYVNNGTDDQTEQSIKEYIEELKTAFDQSGNDQLFFKYKEYEGYGHNFTPIVGMTDALLFHFSQWSIGKDIIDQLWNKEIAPIETFNSYYDNLDDWAGFKVKRENDLLNNLAAHYFSTGDTLKALELIDYAFEVDSTHWATYLQKGEIMMGWDKTQAKEALINALIYLNPEDVFESTKNFREFEFWKSIIEENLKKVDE